MLTWSLYELTQHPEMMARVCAEAAAALPVTAAVASAAAASPAGAEKALGMLPEREAVEGMKFTLGALKETLRLYSVVPCVTRTALVRPCIQRRRYRGANFQPGARVPTQVCPLATAHRRMTCWARNRFLRGRL